MENLTFLLTPFFGIMLSLGVYILGQYLFKITNGFFLFQPLFVGMVLGIIVLIILAPMFHMTVEAFYTKAYKPGGDIIFFFLNPATIAFAIPLYKETQVVKKYWLEIFTALIIGSFIALALIYAAAKLIGLDNSGIASVLPMGATTAIALPIAQSIGGIPSYTALAVILNAVIIYALGKQMVRWFRMENDPIGTGLGLGAAGHTIGSAAALDIGPIQGAMGSIAIVVTGVTTNIVVPIFAHWVGLH